MNSGKDVLIKRLGNGLRVVIRELKGSEVAVVNMMYEVGSRDENKGQRGLAHLLEHVMCGGSEHIGSYDRVLQEAGAESNAYTSFDVTNYWSMLPRGQLERGLWVESERMFFPDFRPRVVSTQKKVVIEEFKEMVLAKPYGDIWHHLLPKVYEVHPYGCPVIGKEIGDMESITGDDLRAFAEGYYNPSNAVLSIVGGVNASDTMQLVGKWFDVASKGGKRDRVLGKEEEQRVEKRGEVRGQVPQDALYIGYRMGGFGDATHMGAQVLAHVIADGKSSLLYRHLVEERCILSEVHAYTLDTIDPGLFMIEGKLQEGVSLNEAEEMVLEICDGMVQGELTGKELERVGNQVEAQYGFGQINLTEQAEDLAWGTLLGNPHLGYERMRGVRDMSLEDLRGLGRRLFQPSKRTIIYYRGVG